MRLRVIWLLSMAGIAVCFQRPACAQKTAEEPFGQISVHGLVAHGLSAHGIPEWHEQRALQVGLQVPFHSGLMEAGVHAEQWQTPDEALPDWTALFMFAGWQADGSVNDRTRLSGGLRLGNYVMLFDTDAVVGQRRESEFGLAPVVGLKVRLTPSIGFHAEAMWLRVWTDPVIETRHVSAGLSIALAMPRWLERFLR